MPFDQGKVTVEEIDARSWRLLEPITYSGREERFEVPAGFETDFATVPRAFTWLIPTYGLYTKAAILHDYLCTEKPVNRADADGIFRRALRELGVPVLRRWMMWAAVRLGGRLADTSPKEFVQWLLVAMPSLAFLIVPGVAVLVFSALFWLLEGLVYLLLKPTSTKQPNPPKQFGLASRA